MFCVRQYEAKAFVVAQKEVYFGSGSHHLSFVRGSDGVMLLHAVSTSEIDVESVFRLIVRDCLYPKHANALLLQDVEVRFQRPLLRAANLYQYGCSKGIYAPIEQMC